MDITDCSAQRFDLGIERFLAGDSLVYNGIVLCQEHTGALVIYSYSEFVHVENSTPEEARAKIDRSTLVLAELCSKSMTVAAIASARPHRYEFCHDYGKGAYRLAVQSEQGFEWNGKR